MIPLARPPILDEDVAAASAVLRSGKLVQGSEVAALEDELGATLGISHVVAVSSGTAALQIALAAKHTGPGDLVLVPAYSWIATANVVTLAGAQPVFVDVRPDSYNMDPGALKSAIDSMSREDRLRVRGLIPVHAFGLIAEMADIQAIGDSLEAWVIEDAACSLGATVDSQSAGTFGDIGCFSFHALKVITTGEGGALVTADPDLASFARTYRDHGQTRGPAGRRFVLAGPNLRMTDFQAALGRSQLARLPAILAKRRDRFEVYLRLLAATEVACPEYERNRSAAQAFVIRLPEDVDRQRIITAMAEADIEVGTGTVAMAFAEHYASEKRLIEELPVTALLDRSALTLPLYDSIGESDQERVIEVLIKAMSSARGSQSA
jgi:dTDP-4-amino-4,6-dideoxygalactose transaminase